MRLPRRMQVLTTPPRLPFLPPRPTQVHALLVAERQRRALEAELCAGGTSADHNDHAARLKKPSKKQKKKAAARAAKEAEEEVAGGAAPEAKAAEAAAKEEEEDDGEDDDELEEAAPPPPEPPPPRPPAVSQPPRGASAAASPQPSPPKLVPTSGLAAALEAPSRATPVFDEAELEMQSQGDAISPTRSEALRDAATFASSSRPPSSASSSERHRYKRAQAAAAAAEGGGAPSRFLPPSDLVAAGGRVVAQELDMDALARQTASFRLVRPYQTVPSKELPGPQPSPAALAATDRAAAAAARKQQMAAAAAEVPSPVAECASGSGGPGGVSPGGGRPSAPSITAPSHASDADEMAEVVNSLQMRVAAEQQCVLREQHITARMWMEKSQAEERAEANERRCEELERNVKAWEIWHQSQRRQQRVRRQKALTAAPDELMRTLLAEWGVQSVQALKQDERHRLAAGLATTVSALLAAKPPPPPGLAAPAPAPEPPPEVHRAW